MSDIEVIEIGNISGPQGPPGPPGTPGTPGTGVPTGGTTGQVLGKTSNANYATSWQNVASGSGGAPSGPAGGSLTGTYPDPGLVSSAVVNLDQFTSSTKGVVPASGGGSSNFLCADGSWAAPSGGAGGSVATDLLWNAKGDLAVATGPDVAVSVPVGANGTVLTADSSLSSGLKWATPTGGVIPYTFTPTKVANYTANANEYIPVNATSGAINITLPTAPVNGTRIAVDVIANTTGNNVTVTCGGADILGNPAGTSTFRIMPIAAQKWRATYNSGCWYEDVRNGFVSAGNVPITPTATLTSTNVQTALQELDGDIQGIVGAGGGGTASTTSFTPAVGVGSTNVQAAIEEVATDITNLPTLTTSNTGKVPVTTALNVTQINVDNLATLADLAGVTGASITAKDEGTNLTTALSSLDFTGAGVTATNTSGAVTVNIPGGGASADPYVYMTTDGPSVISSITPQVIDTSFVMALAANSRYEVKIVVFFTADTGADIKSSVRSSTTGWTFLFSGTGHNVSSVSGSEKFYCQGFDQANFTWSFGSIGNPPLVNSWFGHGIVNTSANAGNLEYWYCQNATSSTATIRKAGSYMVAKKLS